MQLCLILYIFGPILMKSIVKDLLAIPPAFVENRDGLLYVRA